ncbi:MAG: hybrid sensor histidine kinase/response regulator [Opitutaceae bacterium]
MNILLVDDQASDRQLLRSGLEAAGHLVLEARDGAVALEVLAREAVDAVITETFPSEPSGLRWLTAMRRNATWDTLPVIVHTDRPHSVANVKSALDQGAATFLRKPARIERILRALQAATSPSVPHTRATEKVPVSKQSLLDAEIAAHRQTESELAHTRKQLLAALRFAGTAEIATNVLHNVGNVLVSVNVSASVIADSVGQSKISQLPRVLSLLDQHAGDLGAFITTDPKGRRIPAFLAQLSASLHREQADLLQELASLRGNLNRICEIVASQQSMAKLSGGRGPVDPRELVEECLRLNGDQSGFDGIAVIREFDEVPLLVIEKHPVIEILQNLLLNARAACNETRRLDPRVTIRVARGDDFVSIAVTDNGVGIRAEHLPRIFTHGFTTKKNGHGFGLHSAALGAKELGGSLRVQSDGPGCGTTFTLELPLPSGTAPASRRRDGSAAGFPATRARSRAPFPTQKS